MWKIFDKIKKLFHKEEKWFIPEYHKTKEDYYKARKNHDIIMKQFDRARCQDPEFQDIFWKDAQYFRGFKVIGGGLGEKLSNEYEPAVVLGSGLKFWFIDGKRLPVQTQEEFEKFKKLKSFW